MALVLAFSKNGDLPLANGEESGRSSNLEIVADDAVVAFGIVVLVYNVTALWLR